MKTKVLAELVAEVLASGAEKKLDDKRLSQFHQEFESSVSKDAEAIRAEKRRAYDMVKTIAVQ
ncbi:MAG TPA: hypothetical protein VGE57_09105 [Solimonas sp.]